MPSARPFPSAAPLVVLVTALFLLSPRAARAETVVSYKFQDYREDEGRIAVEAHYGLIEQTLGPESKLKLTGVIDTIAGATPTGEPARTADGELPMSEIYDRRKAWTADFSRQFPRINVTLGAANSRESDYVSTGLSLNTLTDFRDKNTTLLLGLSGTRDEVRVFFQPEWEDKDTLDAIVGVTQLLGPRTALVANLSYGRARGYLSDPYKIILKTTEVLPGVTLPLTFGENRPAEREKWIGFTSLNHRWKRWDAALEAAYRLYHDSFGTTSHTLTGAWFQRLGAHLLLVPSVRYYQQSAADFYRVSLDGTSILPGARPNRDGPFYSADYRLARLRTWTYGLKVVWTPREWIEVDAAYERYAMEGRDGVTRAEAFPEAGIFTVGARLVW